MKMLDQKELTGWIKSNRIAIVLLGLCIALASYTATLSSTLNTLRASYEEEVQTRESMSVLLAELEQKYALSEENSSELLSQLNEERGKNEEFEDQIKDISGVVGDLDKLAKTDPELLQKYSKVYFLNEHYMPGIVKEIDEEFVLSSRGEQFIHKDVLPFLDDLLEDAQEDNIDLRVVSAYRSYDEQAQLKSGYTVTYGTGANAFSADQGYSEHQLGTTVDFTTPTLGTLDGFENTTAFVWLQDNAHKYGFVLSYPEDNAYYVYEPWHWRFVGRDLADDLYDDGKSFYDLDQREIDEYLLTLFD